MALPSDPNQPWPPKAYEPHAAEIAEAAAWYAGNEDDLARYYRGTKRTTSQPPEDRFWGRADRTADGSTAAARMHAPVASDVATVAADLLFGDDVTIAIDEAQGEKPDAAAEAVEERLLMILDDEGGAAKLLDAAEIASGLGGAYLRVVVDHDVEPDHPILDVVHPDRAVPEFRWGRLTGVTPWSVIDGDAKGVVRHLERHGDGVIEHGVYVGDASTLGRRLPVRGWPASMAGVAERADEFGAVALADGLDIDMSWVPNATNRRYRSAPWGRSDCAGTERFMDAIDETWSAWMREIRLGKLRIIVPSDFLERPVGTRGAGADWNHDREVYSRVNVNPDKLQSIEQVTFDLRVDKYGATVGELLEVIFRSAGYSASSFGMASEAGAQVTATEVRSRADRSIRTTLRKRRHWERGVETILAALLITDADEFAGSLPGRLHPRLQFPDPDEVSLRERSSTLNLVNLAAAASIETKVRTLWPQWTEERVQAEVERIKAEGGVMVDPTSYGGTA